MTTDVVVLGSGYAGTGAVQRLERALGAGTELTWVSETDYHLVLHESHRIVRDPSVRHDITIPISEIADRDTTFVQGHVTELDVDDREITLDDGRTVDYDYVLVALGSGTAFYGIPGLEANALTLKSLDDALTIHEAVADAARAASRDDPARIVIGGAGLSGIQTAGEVAEYREKHRAPIEITLVEALDEIFPGNDDSIQRALRKRLDARDVEILTADPITEATPETIYFDQGDPLEYDVFVWTGGITGRDCLDGAGLDNEHNRLNCEATFRTSDDRVFAIGDSAIVDQGANPAPPTAQAAWQAADVAGENVARAIRGEPLDTWTHEDKGTVISVGDDAVAHDIVYMPVETFGGLPARQLKKFIAARWIADVTSWSRARRAWGHL